MSSLRIPRSAYIAGPARPGPGSVSSSGGLVGRTDRRRRWGFIADSREQLAAVEDTSDGGRTYRR
jgi:hypothetical protein